MRNKKFGVFQPFVVVVVAAVAAGIGIDYQEDQQKKSEKRRTYLSASVRRERTETWSF